MIWSKVKCTIQIESNHLLYSSYHKYKAKEIAKYYHNYENNYVLSEKK